MINTIINQLKISLLFLITLILLTGLIYPLTVTLIAHLFFPKQANGSLIYKHGKIVGSVLIGQSFTDPGYFWGRPSVTNPFPYNGESSSGSNMGPSNPDFLTTIKNRITYLQKLNPHTQYSIPIDLITASGSGLDPEISPLSALYQVPRVAKLRNISEDKIKKLVHDFIQNRTFGILGEPRVNVLRLNIALDDLS